MSDKKFEVVTCGVCAACLVFIFVVALGVRFPQASACVGKTLLFVGACIASFDCGRLFERERKG